MTSLARVEESDTFTVKFSVQLKFKRYILMEKCSPEPLLFNCWKHHEGFLLNIINMVKSLNDLEDLKEDLKKIGNSTTDLYTGKLSLLEISKTVLDYLLGKDLLKKEIYFTWIDESGEEYRTLEFPDHSIWVLRKGNEPGRHIHIHPGRNVSHTLRVKANVLKTAIAVNAISKIENCHPLDIELINRVREDFMNLSPTKFVTTNQELGRMIIKLAEKLGTVK